MMRSHVAQAGARLQHLLSKINVANELGARSQHLLSKANASSSVLKGNGRPTRNLRFKTKRHDCYKFVSVRATDLSNNLAPARNFCCHFPSQRGFGDHRKYSTETANNEVAPIGDIPVEIPVPFLLHMLDEGPSQEILTSKEELMNMYRHMTTVRRMEITADMLFKSQFVRGFCHLYDGQEAVSVGMEAALTYEDSVLTAYRDHGNYIGRGGTVFEAFSELMGKKTGCAIGKGGSMHLYKKEHNFYGGWGIVGTSGPLGTGLAFANKYLKKKNVAVAIYGDGAANQGQLYDAQNMAALWQLPVIYLVENNHYGMGTAEWRASKKITFYDRLTYLAGIKMDGMDIFAVKKAFEYAKEHCLAGKGPILLEADTYRYHGHSMSDPGSTYRNRSEVQGVRHTRDPIENLRKIILKEEVCTAEELKIIEKEIRKSVEDAAARAKEAAQPADEELFSNIYRLDTGLVTYGCDRRKKTDATEEEGGIALKVLQDSRFKLWVKLRALRCNIYRLVTNNL